MTFIRKILFSVLLVCLFFVTLLAAVDNSDSVALKFLKWESPMWPVSWWVLMAFVFGVLFGIALNFYSDTMSRLDARDAGKVDVDRTGQVGEDKTQTSGAVENVR